MAPGECPARQTVFRSKKHWAYRTRIPFSFKWSSRPHQHSFLSLSYHTLLASDSFVTVTPHSLTRILVCLHRLYVCWEKLHVCSCLLLWNCRWDDRSHVTCLPHTGRSFMSNKNQIWSLDESVIVPRVSPLTWIPLVMLFFCRLKYLKDSLVLGRSPQTSLKVKPAHENLLLWLLSFLKFCTTEL